MHTSRQADIQNFCAIPTIGVCLGQLYQLLHRTLKPLARLIEIEPRLLVLGFTDLCFDPFIRPTRKCLILELAALRARPPALISARGGMPFLFRVVIGRIREHQRDAGKPSDAPRLVGWLAYPCVFSIIAICPLATQQRFQRFPPHRRGNRRTDGLDGAPQWVRVEMRVSMRGRCLRMSQQLADDGQAHGRARADAGKGMPQVVKPHAFELGGLADSGPRLLQIGLRLTSLFARSDMRIAFDAGQAGEHLESRRREIDRLAPDL